MKIAGKFMSFLNFNKKKASETKSSEEISLEQQEIFNEEKEDMIQGIEELHDTTVKEVMVPRMDVDFISIDTETDELLEKISESGHSRFPVYSESIDNVTGVLYVKDIVYSICKNKKIEVEKIIRKPYFVPESKRIDSLLREFKRKHLHIAIAIDEYGGVSGIITMEDIIEEIVGDIQDEFDNEREDITSLGNNTYLCDARVNLRDLNDTIEASFPADDFDSLGGFVFDLFGKVPVKFEKASWNDFDFIVQDIEGHRINSVKVIKKSNDDGSSNDKKE